MFVIAGRIVLIFTIISAWGWIGPPLFGAPLLHEGGCYPTGALNSVVSQGDYLFFASGTTVTMAHRENDQSVKIISRIPLYSGITGLALHGNDLFVTLLYGYLVDISIALPEYPRVVWKEECAGDPYDLVVKDDTLYVVTLQFGLAIYDISTPGRPSEVTWYRLPDTCYAMTVEGDLGVVTSGNGFVWILDLTDSFHPSIMGAYQDSDTTWGYYHVALKNNTVYVERWGGFYPTELVILDIGDPQHPHFVQTIRSNNNDILRLRIWKDYLLVCNMDGFLLMDISTPLEPHTLSGYPLPEASDVTIIGSSAFITSRGGILSTLDISSPDAPQRVGTLSLDLTRALFFLRNGRNYMATLEDGLLIWDMADPLNPLLMSSYDMAYTEKVVIEADKAYLGVGGGYWILDITDLTDPLTLGNIFFLSPYRDFIVKDQMTYLSNDDSLITVDNHDPGKPQLLGYYPLGVSLQLMSIMDDTLIGASGSTLYFIDISQGDQPVLINTLEMSKSVGGLLVDGTILYCSAGDRLTLLDVADPTDPIPVGSYTEEEPFTLGTMALDPPYLLVKTNNQSVIIVNVNDPTAPFRSGLVWVEGDLRSIDTLEHYLYAVVDDDQTQLYSLDHFHGINMTDTTNMPANATSFNVQGRYAYVVEDDQLEVLDLTNPNRWEAIASMPAPSKAQLTVYESYGYIVPLEGDALLILDLSDPHDPQVVTVLPYEHLMKIIVSDGKGIFLMDDNRAVILSLDDPAQPRELGEITTPEIIYAAALQDDLLVLSGDWACYLYDIHNLSNPILLSSWESSYAGNMYGFGLLSEVVFSGHDLLYADWDHLDLMDLSDPAHPTVKASFPLSSEASQAAIYHNIGITIDSTGVLFWNLRDSDTALPLERVKVSGRQCDLRQRGNTLFILCSNGELSSIVITPPLSRSLPLEVQLPGLPSLPPFTPSR